MPFELGIIRNHYVGRTFIEPTDQIRHLGVKLKHNANRAKLAGKRVILVDDSIVRGTTSTKIVEMVRHAGAREVHMRISSPPTTPSPASTASPRPSADQLLASRMDVDEMARVHRRRQPRLRLDRRALPRHGRDAARRAGAAILRRLLHRRLPDPARSTHDAGKVSIATVAARGDRPEPAVVAWA